MNGSQDKIEIQYVDINLLTPSDYNPRQADEKEYNDLKKSLSLFGVKEPALVNSAPGCENIIIGGHFRIRVAKDMGYTLFPVVYTNIPDIEKEKELNIRLNKNSGSWDFDLLCQFDEGMLKDIGFDTKELDKIFQLEPEDKDDVIPDRAPTRAKRGEIYQLGRHRVMCGDSTDAGDVALLMGGGQIQNDSY